MKLKMYIKVFSGHIFIPIVFCFVFPVFAFCQAPVANFSSDIVSGCKPIVVKFTDLSSFNTTGWSWDLGNGVVSTTKDPQTTYLETGTYNIKLTATNADGSTTVIKTAYIKVFGTPDIDFSVNKPAGCTPFITGFTDLSNKGTGGIAKWEWAFGDGGTSNLQNPGYTYTTAGTYNVSLKGTDVNGCSNVAFKSQYVKVGGPLEADFSFSVSPYCGKPVKVFFDNQSNAADSLAYFWNFGDGSTSKEAFPGHEYNSFGSFNVSFVAVSKTGCSDTISKVISIPARFVDFSGPDTVCKGIAANFAVTSSPAPQYVSWRMGDGTTYNTSNISHKYADPGIYRITLVNNFGGCIDSVSKKITVSAGTPASFSSFDTAGCKAPYTANFKNLTPGSVSQAWNFGDRLTSAANSPNHTYNSAGTYNVTLKVTDAAGCVSEVTRTNFIAIKPPEINLKLPVTGCVPFSFTPVYTINHADPIKSYLWSFGDGTTSADSVPIHTYSATGSYTVSLTIETEGGCKEKSEVVNGVKVNVNTSNPFDFKFDPAVVCVNRSVSFTPVVSGQNLAYKWYFGDNVSSGQRAPAHAYQDTGFYTIKLEINFGGCISSVTKANAIKVIGPLSKIGIVKDCSLPGKFNFINLSRNSTSNTWNFGDGATSNDVNPKHTYNSAGNYTVKLVTKGDGCIDTAALAVPVWLDKIKIFAGSNDICKNDSIAFMVIHPQPDSVRSYNFNFTGTVADSFVTTPGSRVRHAYQTNGNYKAAAFTVDNFGCRDTAALSTVIDVHGPTAQFGVVKNDQCAGLVSEFIDTSLANGSDAITNWKWNYGDGIIRNYSSPPFKHVYTVPGAYTVSLKVKDQSGCTDSLNQPDFITSSYVKADFSSIDSFSCPGKPVHFFDRSAGAVFSRIWNFGDGAMSTDANPVHVYSTPGTYTIKLIVSLAGGCADSITKVNYVSLNYPKAAFSLSDSVATCPPLQVRYYDSSKYVESYLWNLGDTTVSSVQNPAANYFLPGNYNVKLTVTSPGGCKDSAFATVYIAGPNGVISYSPVVGCIPLAINSNVKTTGAIYFTWDFNDGFTSEGPDSSSSHIYSSGGKFLPRVILRNPEGCNVPIIGHDTVFAESLLPRFAVSSTSVCDTATVHFTDSSRSTGTLTYKWYFGDGTFAAEKNPAHSYATPGKYSVKLVITSSFGCSDSVTYANFIDVLKLPEVSIIANPMECAGGILFHSQEVVDPAAPVIAYNWKFGNNDSSKFANPPEQLFPAGNYINYLTVTNTNGCVNTFSKALLVNPLPVLLLSPDTTICQSDTIQLNVAGAATYNWSDAANTLSCTGCSNPFSYPTRQIGYRVTGTASTGCSSQDSITVNVLLPFTVQATTAYDLCQGKSVQLHASWAPLYNWSPSQGLNAVNIANPVATPFKTTVYTVAGLDSIGCFTDTATTIITVHNLPAVELGKDIIASAGNTMVITPVVSQDVIKYLWTPSSYLSCSTCPAPEATATSNITYRLAVTSDVGCTASDTLRIIVNCGADPLFIPNTFSPNNDGSNDVFYVRSKGISVVNYMRILSRTGETVFEKRYFTPNDPSAGWDGIYKGKPAEIAVYIYLLEVICDNNEILKYSGNVSLIR